MWYEESVFYQIYPLGLCGAPRENDGIAVPRLLRLLGWVDHIQTLGANAVYLCPVFESDAHGYDTRDYRKVDTRLGTNADLAQVCQAFHDKGVRVVLDGVFNHVGRGFWAFQDVLAKKWDSPYKDWFYVDFGGNSPYNDGFWYKGWEGHYELVALNLQNPAVVAYLLETIGLWMDWFHIDGLRLDVAYALDPNFLRQLRAYCQQRDPSFFLLGEMLHGDYNRLVNPEMLHSCTNYECYKGLYSSFNSMNMFEIAHSIARQFGPENWTLYKGKHLLCFADNHDVERVASILQCPQHLPLLYGLLFAMPGIPCIYYGSEWGIQGRKRDGDWALRPALEGPVENDLSAFLRKLAHIHTSTPALCHGDYGMKLLTNRQYIFQRAYKGQRVLVAINADSVPFTAHFDAGAGQAVDRLTGLPHDFGGGSLLPPYSVAYWELEAQA